MKNIIPQKMTVQRAPLYIVILALLIWPMSVLADRSTAGDINKFDIQPRTINAGQQFRVTFRFLVYGGTPSAYLNYCGVSSSRQGQIHWSVYENTSGGEKVIQVGQVTYDPYTYANKTYDVSFDKTLPDFYTMLPDRSGTRTFYGKIWCTKDGLTKIMSTATGVEVTQNQSTGGGGGGGSGGGNPGTPFNFPNPLKTQTVGELIGGLIKFAYQIGIPIAVAIIVYAGILFLTSRGNPSTVTNAKNILLWAVIGLGVLFIGRGFLTLIQSILDLANG